MNFFIKRSLSILIAIGACLVAQFLVTGHLSAYEERLITLAGLYVTLATSLNLINGITGQFSIGHAAFYLIGAYITGFITIQFFNIQPFHDLVWALLMVILSALSAAGAGFLVSLPSLRLQGDYLAIVTLGFGEIIRIFVQNIQGLGGAYGLNVYSAAPLSLPFIAVIWLIAVLCIAISRNLLKTSHGLSFLAIRDDELASRSIGINVTKVKVMAFTIGAAFAGAAGAMLALYEGFITPGTFTVDTSVIILTMVILGGSGSITGTVFAALALFYIPEWLRDQPNISSASFIAACITYLVTMILTLKIIKNPYPNAKSKIFLYIGVIFLAVGLQIGVAQALTLIPTLGQTFFEGNKLRMVIFAATMITVMLLRPQGMFDHHEFSWKWLFHCLRIKKKEEVQLS